MSGSYWRRVSQASIYGALDALPAGASEGDKRKAVSAAYPFGERRMYPYKVWLEEVRRALEPAAPVMRPADRQRIEAYEQATGKKFPIGGAGGI